MSVKTRSTAVEVHLPTYIKPWRMTYSMRCRKEPLAGWQCFPSGEPILPLWSGANEKLRRSERESIRGEKSGSTINHRGNNRGSTNCSNRADTQPTIPYIPAAATRNI